MEELEELGYKIGNKEDTIIEYRASIAGLMDAFQTDNIKTEAGTILHSSDGVNLMDWEEESVENYSWMFATIIDNMLIGKSTEQVKEIARRANAYIISNRAGNYTLKRMTEKIKYKVIGEDVLAGDIVNIDKEGNYRYDFGVELKDPIIENYDTKEGADKIAEMIKILLDSKGMGEYGKKTNKKTQSKEKSYAAEI